VNFFRCSNFFYFFGIFSIFLEFFLFFWNFFYFFGIFSIFLEFFLFFGFFSFFCLIFSILNFVIKTFCIYVLFYLNFVYELLSQFLNIELFLPEESSFCAFRTQIFLSKLFDKLCLCWHNVVMDRFVVSCHVHDTDGIRQKRDEKAKKNCQKRDDFAGFRGPIQVY